MSRTTLLATLSATALAAPLAVAVPASAATTTVTVLRSVTGTLAAYDPGGTLGLPGDTHQLSLALNDSGDDGVISVTSYSCGPHDTSRTPEQLGCPWASPFPTSSITVTGARVDGSRWRASTEKGALSLRVSGGERQRWVSREWENAEGTRHERGRETLARDTGGSASGTLAGLALARPEAWRAETVATTSRTRVTVRRGPAVPLPDLPPAGTGPEAAASMATSEASWQRAVAGGLTEVGSVSAGAASTRTPTGPWASSWVTRQRCDAGEEPLGYGQAPGPGLCDLVEQVTDQVEPGYRYAVDNRAGTARLSGRATLFTAPGEEQPPHAFTATWRGSRPVGVRNVQRSLDDPSGEPSTRTESGIRWRRVTARVTWDGERVPVTGATLYAWLETLG